MKALERWSLHGSALAMGLSGLSYGYLKYFGQRQGPFGPEQSPLQGWAQHAHVLLGPWLVFSLGMVVKAHVAPRLKAGRARRTGFAVALVLAPLVLSGYTVEVAVEPAWRVGCAWVHGCVALLFLAGYAVHLLRPAGGRRPLARCEDLD
jgi:hypothetical protein